MSFESSLIFCCRNLRHEIWPTKNHFRKMYIIRMIRIKTVVFISHDNFLENSFKTEKCNSFDIIEKIHQQDKFRDLRNF